MKVALITGASSGIGYETAILLQKNGFKVYGGARTMEKLKELEQFGIDVFYLDVTDEIMMEKSVKEIILKEGKIDILINSAGYGSYGSVEDVSLIEARKQLDVNLFGMAKMIKLVLPIMRENNFGKIINISSIGGKVHTYFGAWYHATKFAVEGFSDCLRLEMDSYNIDVIVIEPGGIKTNWGKIAGKNLKKTSGKGVYSKEANNVANSMIKLYESDKLTPPKEIAELILKSINSKKPKTRYLYGYMAKSLFIFKRLLSDRLYDKFLKFYYKNQK